MLRRLKVPHSIIRLPLNSISSVPSVRLLTTEEKNDARTRQYFRQELLPEIKTILALEDNESNSQRWMHVTLKDALKEVPSPHRLLEDLISFLLRKGFPTHAFTVFQRLQKAGFLPTNHVIAQMLAPLLSSGDHDPIDVAQSIVNLMTDTGYNDSQLLVLLQVISEYGADEGIVYSIVYAYWDSQGPGYIPSPLILSPVVKSLVHFGKIENAFEMLSLGSHRTKARSKEDADHIFSAFIGFIGTLHNIRAEDSQSVARVLNLLGSRGWLLSARLFDALIAREVKAGSPRVAMTLYSMMKDLDAMQSIRPTPQTFGSLFCIYRRMKPKKYQSIDPSKPVSFFLPLRMLSRELEQAVSREVKPLIPSTALLNTALRAYLRQRDYPGAFVTLESFTRYGIPLDHRTYHATFKLIIRRIWYEIEGKRRSHEVRWADRFLGVSYRDVELSTKLVDHILYIISREQFSFIQPMYPSPPERDFRQLDDKGLYEVPTVFMMEHKYRPEPWNFRYEIEPLLRLLRRAIWAGSSDGSVEIVEEAIAKAKKDMHWSSPQSSNSLLGTQNHTVSAVAAA